MMAVKAVSAASAVYQCKSCERELGANEFYASNLSTCKECVKARVRENRAANADYYRAYDRKRYREDPVRKEHCRAQARKLPSSYFSQKNKERREQDPQRFKARNAVNNALRDGRLTKPDGCFFCGGGGRLHAHHEDYDHPLDVVWLCPSCHGKLHIIKGDFRRTAPEIPF